MRTMKPTGQRSRPPGLGGRKAIYTVEIVSPCEKTAKESAKAKGPQRPSKEDT
ncbi:MAG TPA: hypothetical protein PLM74_09210 [Bacillota bacterium]|jgi:hypothetical protein|nr:hypothetical protein [Bacillota bacterium]